MKTDESTDKYQVDNPELFALLGKFMVEFQSFYTFLRISINIMEKITNGSEDWLFKDALTAEMTAMPLLKAFNSIALGMRELNIFEKLILDKIYKRATTLIENRNKFIHGQWFANSGRDDTGRETGHLKGYQTKHSKNEGFRVTVLTINEDEFVPLIKECEELGPLLLVYAQCFTPNVDFSKYFLLGKDDRVTLIPKSMPEYWEWVNRNK